MEATKKTQGKWQIMCLVLLLAGMIFGISRDAAALERIFTENEQSVYVGDESGRTGYESRNNISLDRTINGNGVSDRNRNLDLFERGNGDG